MVAIPSSGVDGGYSYASNTTDNDDLIYLSFSRDDVMNFLMHVYTYCGTKSKKDY